MPQGELEEIPVPIQTTFADLVERAWRGNLQDLTMGGGSAYTREVRARQGRAVAALLPQVRDVRRRGSCALDLCGLAAGECDAYVEEGPHLWDHAAAGLVAQEAGARVEVWPAPRMFPDRHFRGPIARW